VLAIGLDVGDGRLLRHWAEAGALPHLKRLIDEGAWGTLGTPAETLHVSAWPSLYTGTSPGKHGVYYTFQPAPGEQGAVRFRPDQYGQPTVWELAARAGKRCVVFDAPYTHPVAGGATQVFEWGTWAHYWTPSSVPEAQYGALVKECGKYPLGYEANQIGLSALDPAELAPKLVESAAAKGRAARWLLGREPWDLGFVVFGETHPATHYLWPADREPGDVSGAPAEFERSRAVYAAVDEAIGALLEGVGDGDHVLVVSGDGGGPNYAGWHLLPEVLMQAGLLVPPGARDQQEKGGGQPKKAGLYGRLRGLVPTSFRQSVSRYLPAAVRDKLMKKGAASQVDWEHTRAFLLPTDLEGCIRINLKGREPEGLVAPEEFDRTCAEVEQVLRELVNPATGEKAVTDVVRVAEAFPGERADRLPDLVVAWDERSPITELQTAGGATVSAASPDGRTGTHRPPGFMIARGPGFDAGSELAEAQVVDFAPTLLRHLGVEVPAEVEGRALGI
jgi:predicted AlkP superfamily phosphohydrolase/phosphomutase